MDQHQSQKDRSRGGQRTLLIIATLVGAIGFLMLGTRPASEGAPASDRPPATAADGQPTQPARGNIVRHHHGSHAPTASAEKVVAGKLRQFTKSRRTLARSMAKKAGVGVPDDVEQFFSALEAGYWPDIEAQWTALAKRSGQYEHSTNSAELNPVWSAVLDAYGVAEQVHEWPAQQLLDYGNAILGSLKPGMVYVGGNDNGRWIPELLNETNGGEPHVIVTQNAMADTRYIEYMNTLYGDRIATLNEEDSKHAFEAYTADARKRLEHDQQFPEEPKQVKPGEQLKLTDDGRFEVGGQVAVMAINEKLLQGLMAKNPDLQFALQESSPLQGTYADAVPLGPLMELGAKDSAASFTPERAAQTVDYWKARTEQILSDPEATESPYALKSHAHDTVSAGNLLAARGFIAEAEQAYRLAGQLWADNPESMGGLAKILTETGRQAEARQLIETYVRQFPDRRSGFEALLGDGGKAGAPTPTVPKP